MNEPLTLSNEPRTIELESPKCPACGSLGLMMVPVERWQRCLKCLDYREFPLVQAISD